MKRRLFFTAEFISIFIAILLVPQCRIFRGITDPALRLYRRGSCISIDVPPITLTPAQTALERQLIGEDAELEENGWLVASAKSSRSGNEQSASADRAREIYREIGILEYLDEDIQRYKKSGIIGESHEGNLKMLPPELRSAIDADEIRKVSLLIQETNRARENIYRYFLQNEKNRGGRNSEWADKNYRVVYFEQARSGEWRMQKNGVWEKVK